MKQIRILIVEDETSIRELLLRWLEKEPDIECLGAVATLSEGLAALRNLQPDVVLTDLRLPDGNGVDLIREARKSLPATEVMVISALCDEAIVVEAIRAGAGGYLLKDALPSDFSRAIRDIVNGRSTISSSIARHIVRELQIHDAPREPVHSVLTEREVDVLYGVAKGLTYEDIARQFGISQHTVASHIKSIYRKLEVTSRGEAVFEAVSRKIIRF